MLALAAPDTVAATTLIDLLWPEQDLPGDPANALQIRVSKLRRALAGMDSQPLVARHGSGYRLEVDASAVDAHRFAALVQAARRCGDPVQAIDMYDQALALWRAEPLVDFAGEAWTTVDSARLCELRLAAASERAERMLILGRYDELAADLEPLVAEAPTREKLVAQLMTALFNAGRQAEALVRLRQDPHAAARGAGTGSVQGAADRDGADPEAGPWDQPPFVTVRCSGGQRQQRRPQSRRPRPARSTSGTGIGLDLWGRRRRRWGTCRPGQRPSSAVTTT